ncbi:MAG: NAD-dependent epimerase/dehydratase family protein [Gemmatimonadota bacterium]
MKVLVTGGAGFIGSHVVDRLVARGDDVIVLDNLDPQVHGPDAVPRFIGASIAARKLEFLQGDIRDPRTIRRALNDVDRVIHLAAAVGVGQSMYAPHYYTSVNVDGQGVLLEAIAQQRLPIRRMVVASSMSIYGEGAYRCVEHGEVAPAPRPASQLAAGRWEVECPLCGVAASTVPTREEKPLQHTSIYAITKKTQEELALCFGRAYEIPTLALRFFNVYGSRQSLLNPYTGVAAIFMSRLMNGEPPLLFEDGAQTRDFIHVSDLADAVIAALDSPSAIEGALNICTGTAVSIREIAERIAACLGVSIEPRVVGRYRVGDIRHCFGDRTRSHERLQLAAPISLDEGLGELIAWSAEQQAQDHVHESLAELERTGLLR